ncbi:MAG: hypothetical protein U1E86_13675 [Burkholderiaceae bacterium]
MYLNHARRFGMEHILRTVIPDRCAGLVTFISFWRADCEHPCAKEERALKEFPMPHLVEVRRLNVFAQIRSRLGGRMNVPCEMAASDRDSVRHDAEPRHRSRRRRRCRAGRCAGSRSTIAALRRTTRGVERPRGDAPPRGS